MTPAAPRKAETVFIYNGRTGLVLLCFIEDNFTVFLACTYWASDKSTRPTKTKANHKEIIPKNGGSPHKWI